MCDFFWPRMDSNNQGDLADIVRATARAGPSTAADPAGFPPPAQVHEAVFGDPFAILGESPLLHESPGPAFFDFDSPPAMREEIERPCNIFSRMLQISPGAAKASLPSPRAIKPSPIATEDMLKVTSSSSAFQADHVDGLQISSPRTPGIKRRKSQAKKVVCVPAPAAAGSRASGEVVPSDLWAWRKYGQKPIKGSPYPRGYYRCSSSKGCPARKQVERSRTDPNMLVITYTSEHNHPWPTQRNALAGSTRSQLAKNSSSSSKSSPRTQRSPITMKEEPKETKSSSTPLVKQEDVQVGSHEFDQIFDQSYKPMIPDSNQSDDFFAELAELESDPMNLIFSKGFMGDKEDEERVTKSLDPFTMFDWPGNSFGEPKKSL